jgi:hypothetical protein
MLQELDFSDTEAKLSERHPLIELKAAEEAEAEGKGERAEAEAEAGEAEAEDSDTG